jgi:hypothetical protein
MIRRVVVHLWLVACFVAADSPGFAQGNPHHIPPGQTKRAQQVPSTSGLVSAGADAPAPIVGRVRTFGTWLDDASTIAPGEAWLALSMSRWEMPVATGADAPVVDLSVGLAPRVQTSVTIPYFHVTDRSGASIGGLGDLYVGTKIVLRDAATHTVGFAVSPTLEYLSETSITGTGLDRMNWILPLSIERRFGRGRVYGSTGYFTRGAFFVSGAFERVLTQKLVVSAVLSHALATDREAISEEIGLGRQRLDLNGTAGYSVSPALVVFGSLGRTVLGFDDDSTRLLASAGVSINLKGLGATR